MLNVNPAVTCPMCCEQTTNYEVFDSTIMLNKYIINNKTETINDVDNNDNDEDNNDGQVFNFHPYGNIIDLDISASSDSDTGVSICMIIGHRWTTYSNVVEFGLNGHIDACKYT